MCSNKLSDKVAGEELRDSLGLEDVATVLQQIDRDGTVVC